MNIPLNVDVNAEDSAIRSVEGPVSTHVVGAIRMGFLVLGMHRSGTSAVARMLNLLGCSLPQTLLGANETNPAGHWESEAILAFNDELLALAGSTWDDWLPVGPGFFSAPGYPALVARGGELLRSEFGNASLFVFKDPRNCRLARFWLDVFAAEAVTPSVIIPIRNPLEVARSLSARDQADEHYGPLLWLRHVLDAEAGSRSKTRVFTSYDQLLDSWEVVASRLQAGLGITWPRMSPATQEEIGAFINKRHRREHAAPAAILNNPLVSSWVRRAFEVLDAWAVHGENKADHAELDAIRQAFDDAAPAFARLILRGIAARHRVQALEAEVLQAAAARAIELEAALELAHSHAAAVEADAAEQLANQQEVLSQKAADAQAERDAIKCQIDELTGLRSAAEGHAAALTARVAELEWLLGETRAKVEAGAALRGHVEELAGSRDAAESRAAAISGQNAVLQWLLGEAQAKAEAASERFHAAADAIAKQEHRIAEQASALIQRREENEQAWAALSQEQAVNTELRGLVAASTEREETQRQRLVEAEAGLMRLVAERQAAQDEVCLAREVAEREKLEVAAETERRARHMALQLSDAQASKAHTEAQLAERSEEAARMTVLLDRAEREAEAAGAQAQAARAALDQQRQVANASHARCTELEQQVAQAQQGQVSADIARQELAAAQAERFNEIAVLTGLLRDRERETDKRGEHLEWLRKTQIALASTPYWWTLLPRSWRRQRELGVLQRKQLFDAHAYLSRYPDVAAEGMDPLIHYLRHGLNEGRDHN